LLALGLLRATGAGGRLNLENLLCAPNGFQLTTATNLQRAICRMETGEPLEEYANCPEVIECIGGAQAFGTLPRSAPSISVLLAAVRSAKSLKAAAKAFRASHVADLSKIKPDEIARYSVLSVDKDKANAVMEHLTGKVNASPALSASVIKVAGESMWIMRADGRVVEIKVMAGKRAGSSVVARWSAGVTLDEGPRMNGSEHVVNLPDLLVNLPARMLPGTQIDIVGSPWGPSGPVYDMYIDCYGRPSSDMLFMIAKGPDMHPAHFTPEFCAKLAKEDPRAHRTDVLAMFADPEDSLLSSLDVEECTRKGTNQLDLQPNEQPCSAAIDPANRRNAWTLVITRPTADGKRCEVVLARQWMGSKSAPLASSRVFAEMKPLLELYKVDHVWTDQASFNDKFELAQQAGITLIEDDFTEANWRAHAKLLEKHVSERTISLPPNAALRADILGIQRRLTARSWQIVLPSTGDGRHGDYAPALCLSLKHLPSPLVTVEPSGIDENERRVLDFINSSKSNPTRHAAERLRSAFA
jgi:hypothetical protein